MVALARVVFTSREHVIALEPRGKGLLGVTLRYPYEVRKEDEYFDDIEDEVAFPIRSRGHDLLHTHETLLQPIWKLACSESRVEDALSFES
jgi:non-homologous end joining protein Ku